ncbi:hypothetical protein OAG71_05185 [bacterium]|nr:hypothetical protein [bacterium]
MSASDNLAAQIRFPLYLCAAILIIAGLAHFPIYWLSGESWEGPVSWRKPILFGISTGLTVWSVGYVMPRLNHVRGDLWLSWLFSIALLIEVGLITMQKWRGEASHFNYSTALNAAVAYTMLAMITFATVVIIYIAIRSLRHLDVGPDVRLSINSGFAFLVISCIIGFVISEYGNHEAMLGNNPSVYGEAGVTKFPHGVAIHAIQILPAVCWVLYQIGVPMIWRKRVVWGLTIFMAAVLIFSIVQTLRGKARYDLTLDSKAATHRQAFSESFSDDQHRLAFYHAASD